MGPSRVRERLAQGAGGSPPLEYAGGIAAHPPLPTTDGLDLAEQDANLLPALRVRARPDDAARAEPLLRELGALAGGELGDLARAANANPPVLRQYDARGERIDEVVHHPAYRELCRLGFERFQLAAMSHRPALGWPTPVPHIVKYALSYVFAQGEFGVLCPISMTDSAARVLRRFGGPELAAPYLEGLTAPRLEDQLTGAMFVTERQGGSDVGATGTEARPDGTHWRLSGQKWFASNVDADVVLTLARLPDGAPGTRGLGLFLVPRRCPDGTRNGYRIDRLKDKLGTRSMATGEVTLAGAFALPVGDLGQGFRQMAEMINVSRLSNAMRSAGLMRRALLEAVWHARHRHAFGRRLLDQPLLRRVLLPLVLHTEASLALVLEAAAVLDATDAGSPDAARRLRLLTPLAKYTICKRARTVTAEAMEVRGGNGYVEDWIDPRLLRDAHLGSIWEGSSNVVALDVGRAMRREGAVDVLLRDLLARLQRLSDPDVRRVAEALAPDVEDAAGRVARVAEVGDEAVLGALTERLCDLTMAVLLLEEAEAHVRAGLGYRKLLVAATYLAEVVRDSRPWDEAPAALGWLDELTSGGDVPAEAALSALPTA
jgi:acyl-CoA dehydrogenase